MIRQLTWFGLVFVMIAGCRPTRTMQSDSSSTAAITSLDHPWLNGGIAPVVKDTNSTITSGSTRSLITDYHQAAKSFRDEYGQNTNPYWIVSVRANRFISRNAWDKVKHDAGFNPIAATDQYEFKHGGKCRPEGMNVWAAYERASMYVNRVMGAAMTGQNLPWSDEYLSLAHVKNELIAVQKSGKNSSERFDLDVIQSVHAANGEGATQNSDVCGKIAQLKLCDGHSYSPFFSPWYRSSVCTATDWTTGSEKDWTTMMSDEMRNLGQTIVPVPSIKVIGSHKPDELKGIPCPPDGRDTPEVDTWRKDVANDWPMLKKRYANFSAPFMQNSGRETKVQQLAALSGKGDVAAYMIMAPVVQVYKEIANMTLKPGVIKNAPECKPCEPVKVNGEWLWDPVRRAELNLGYCPRSCWAGGGDKPSTEMVRQYFQDDPFEPRYPSITNKLNRHFAELHSGASLSNDPVKVATQVQQSYVAMHPFIDGDGRTSRYYMEIILNSVGLPFPVLTDFWADTTRSEREYEQIIRDGISRHINIVKACTAYVACRKKENRGFKVESICAANPSNSCLDKLQFSYGISDDAKDNISPCDCSINWDKNPDTAKYKECH